MKCNFCFIAVLLNTAFVTSTTVYLLFPKGFSINIQKVNNNKIANFEVNITRDNGNLAVARFNKLVRNAFAGQWTFAQRNIVLKIGDVISYKIITDVNDSHEKIEEGVCSINEIPKIGHLRRHGMIHNYDINLSENSCITNDNRHELVITETPVVETVNQDMKRKLGECEQAMFNTSLSLMSLQLEVEELRNKTQQLTDFEETYPLAKQLTLSGRIPPDGDPVDIVQFMIYEKLDLRPNIVSAFRDAPYNIRFTVSSVIEKLQILEIAKFILPSTKVEIS